MSHFPRPAVLVHGGCGRRPREIPAGRDEALAAAARDALRGRSALDIVERAVRALEDCPLFNAGTGSVLNLEGACEMDAALMTGDLRAGAVGGIRGVRNPIRVARTVLEKSDHHFLVGEGATRFARIAGFPRHDPRTPERRRRWRELLSRARQGKGARYFPRLSRWIDRYLPPAERGGHSTVGAVAVDRRGGIAAATSTGGIWLKLPGRVGDTPLLGSGTWADAHGAVSATGHGEGIVRLGLARLACGLMARMPAQRAVDRAVALARRAGVEAGLIAVDARGRLGSAHNAPWMPVARAGGAP